MSTSEDSVPEFNSASATDDRRLPDGANANEWRSDGAAECLEAEAEGFPIVAIGASAGGLAALEKVFGNLADNLGAAYIVLQHLSPDFESHMTELLGRVTHLPVTQASDRTELVPDHVYVIPPKKEMILAAGKLLLTDKDPRNAPSLPIDTFLRSMAREAGARSVAIILSGTGSDGARGVREVKSAGGCVIVQDPDDADFDGMPRSAVATGVADLVLRAGEMPTELARMLPIMMSSRKQEQPQASNDVDVRRILDLLEQEHDVDFSCYKTTTLGRRIRRRAELSGVSSIERYAALLAVDREESKRLFHDLLIGVTQFFRDEDAYEKLAAAAREILFSAENAEIRVWVAGCATGEEVYSVAMLLDETRNELRWPGRIRLFATDIHQEALKRASAGIYPRQALEDMSESRRERYFTPHGQDVRVVDSLREMVIFATHNLVTDAPFTQLDLVCCRNVLIYFQPGTQAKVLALFHFGLRTGGLLFLGPSETLGKLEDEFEAVNAEARVFAKRRDLRLLSHPAITRVQTGRRRREPQALIAHADRSTLDTYEVLLNRCMPTAFLLDEHFQLVHCFGGAERFLEVRAGRVSTALPSLLKGRIRNAVSGLLDRYKHDGASAHIVNLRRSESGEPDDYRIVVTPVAVPRAGRTNVLVEIHPVAAQASLTEAVTPEAAEAASVAAEYVESLERDLELARGQLQTTVEELEAANEELQAANEELIASNEELQSTNEELRSVNEELNSVNVDHQKKIAELSLVTEDLENLLHTIPVGVLFLDENLNIRRANNRIADWLHILPQDIGRSFEHFKNNLHEPSAFDAVRAVLANGARVEHEIRTPAGQVLLLNVTPYTSAEAQTRGVVLTIVDITAHRAAENEARRLSAIVRGARDAIISTTLDGTVRSWNTGAEKLYGYTEDEVIGQHARVIVPGDRFSEIDYLLGEVVKGNDVPPFETIRVAKDGAQLHILLSVAPIRSEAGTVTGASMIGFDITDRKLAEERATIAVEQRDKFLALLSHELRNPLMALASANEILLRSDRSSDAAQRAQEIITRQIKQMARLLEDTLDASRMRHDTIELNRKIIDLKSVIEGALDVVRPRAVGESIALTVELPDDPVHVKGDATRLQQVVVNLVQNAINHSSVGRAVHVSVLSEGQHAVIRVADQGIGIPADVMPRIFEPFFQASRRSKNGMGLGLALARSIVRAHSGEIVAASGGFGQGAVFEARLPLLDARIEQTAELLALKKNGNRERPSILLIDDDGESRESVGTLLRESGYLVHEAKDGSEGLQLIDDVMPSVVVLDLGLPDISGLEVARTVRTKYGWKPIKLVALTGFGRQTDREAAIEAGCDMHLVKPVDFATLEKVISYQASR